MRSIRSGADGVVVQVQNISRLTLNHHPVRSIKGSFAIFLLMSRPPLLARRGDGPGPPSMSLPPKEVLLKLINFSKPATDGTHVGCHWGSDYLDITRAQTKDYCAFHGVTAPSRTSCDVDKGLESLEAKLLQLTGCLSRLAGLCASEEPTSF